MAWVAVGMVGGALVSGYFQNKSNQQSANASKNLGKVDTVSTRSGDPRADPYRNAGMSAAYSALFGQSPDFAAGWKGGAPPPVAGAPAGTAGYPGRNDAGIPAGSHVNGAGKLVNSKGKAWSPTRDGGGTQPPASGPTPAAPKKFEGMSDETVTIREQMLGLGDKNAGMYGDSESYLRDTLGGRERNPYREDAAGAAHAISSDPGLTEYQAALKKALGLGGAADGGGGTFHPATGNSRASYSVGSEGGGLPAGGYGASATGTDAALKKLVAGEDPAGWKEMQDAISRKVAEERAGNIRELKAGAVGSGFYGGDMYERAIAGAVAKGDQELADSLSQARFGAYQDALGLGTQYDLGMADMSSRERIASANASAAGAGAAADAASREKLALYGMWGDALGQGLQGRTASAGALGDLAGLTSADQRAAVEGVSALGASRRADLGAAGDLSLGADSNRNSYLAARGNERVGMANVNLGNRQLGWSQQQFYDPLNRTLQYGNALGLFYGGLGDERTYGTDTRSSVPPAFGSVGGAALQGAALGGQLASLYQSNNPQTAPAGGSAYRYGGQ